MDGSTVIRLDDWRMLQDTALRYVESRHFDEARRLLTRALDQRPDALEPAFHLLSVSRDLADEASELRALAYLIFHQVASQDLLRRGVELAIRADHMSLAFSFSLRLWRLNPGRNEALLSLVEILLIVGKPRIATQVLEPLAKNKAMRVPYLQKRLLVSRELQDYHDALEAGRQLLTLDADNPLTHFLVGTVYEASGDLGQARRAFHVGYKLAERDPTESGLLAELADRVSALDEKELIHEAH